MSLSATLRSVLDAKREEIHVVDESATVRDAAARMRERGIGALVVLDDGGRVAGMFSERDVLNRVVAAGLDPDGTAVSKVMTPDPVCVDASMTVAEAMAKVSTEHIRHLPLMTGDRLEGLISSGDLTAWVLRYQEAEIDDLGSRLGAASTRTRAVIGLFIAAAVLAAIAALST